MSLTTSSPIWDSTPQPDVADSVRRFEEDWRAATESPRPDPESYLPERPDERPSALLALLRLDLSLRRQAGEKEEVESYFERYPDLPQEARVALIYEEFCLREENGERPDPAGYEIRFPEIATLIREILDIHKFVVDETDATAPADGSGSVPFDRFPKAGQTIAGFYLVAELGRGSFAHVFRAEERQLADRPVALKIARAGSREPQTLARLQHTHIVPIHSYRIDPATGLHLLCMPYLGHVTLAHLLAAVEESPPRSGAELIAALDRLEAPRNDVVGTAGRKILAGRSYTQAIAGWGASLAEALQFAHERGILHLDIKPSNILVTSDGMPLLLDFNLANAPATGDDNEPNRFGGTMAYMAPEHLEALVSGGVAAIDHRADLFALGGVLHEALGGEPFSVEGTTFSQRLRNAIASRRSGAPRLRPSVLGVSPALEAVVRKCLAPTPDDRYATAADLAVDLQAVAEDAPLRHAREPWPGRLARSLRRNRRRVALAIPILMMLVLAIVAWGRSQVERGRQEARFADLFQGAEYSGAGGEFALAAEQFARAADEIRDRQDLRLRWNDAKRRQRQAIESQACRERVDRFLRRGEELRFGLLGLGGDSAEASRDLEIELQPLSVLKDPSWTRQSDLQGLDPGRRAKLMDAVNDLLFLWIVVSDQPGNAEMAGRAVALCDLALRFTEPKGPWLALRAHYQGARPAETAFSPGDDPVRESSARACFQWSLLSKIQGDREKSLAWLERAVQLRPDQYWYQFDLAYHYDLAGRVESALVHYGAAIALRPESPWVLLNRAHLYWSQRGAWDRALRDLNRAIELASDRDATEIHLERGRVFQRVGDYSGARAAYDRVLASSPNTRAGRVARLNRAKLEADSGATGRAMAEYNTLLAEDPADAPARLGRALLTLRLEQAGLAEEDLTLLLQETPSRAERARVLAYRASARLAQGQPAQALADAEESFRLDPRPSRQRLAQRARLAAGQALDLTSVSPEDLVNQWPALGKTMDDELRFALQQLRFQAIGTDANAFTALRTRAVLLSALGEHRAAEREASRAVALVPLSPAVFLLRARIRRHRGDQAGARKDLARGLQLEPADAPLLLLRGLMALEEGHAESALLDADHAANVGPSERVHVLQANALFALGRYQEAIDAWTQVLSQDPEEAPAFLERARAFAALGLWDQALADLERAADWTDDRLAFLVRLTLVYVDCVKHRPERSLRLLGLARRLPPAWFSELLRVSRSIFPEAGAGRR